MTKHSLQDIFKLWEASALNHDAESWHDAEPEEKNKHLPPEDVGDKRDEKVYLSAKPVKSNEGDPKTWDSSKINTLAKKTDYVPGDDKDKDVMQLDQEQDKLHKLEEELTALGAPEELEEASITPDMGSSLLRRSPYAGVALQPPNGYGPNTVPGEPAPEEVPPGYEKNTSPDPLAPEEGSKTQRQSVAPTLVSPKQFLPREGTRSDVHRRLQEHIFRVEQARKAKLR